MYSLSWISASCGDRDAFKHTVRFRELLSAWVSATSSRIACWSSINRHAPKDDVNAAFDPLWPVIDGGCNLSNENFVLVKNNGNGSPPDGDLSLLLNEFTADCTSRWVVSLDAKLKMPKAKPLSKKLCRSCTTPSGVPTPSKDTVLWKSTRINGFSTASSIAAGASGLSVLRVGAKCLGTGWVNLGLDEDDAAEAGSSTGALGVRLGDVLRGRSAEGPALLTLGGGIWRTDSVIVSPDRLSASPSGRSSSTQVHSSLQWPRPEFRAGGSTGTLVSAATRSVWELSGSSSDGKPCCCLLTWEGRCGLPPRCPRGLFGAMRRAVREYKSSGTKWKRMIRSLEM